MPINTARQRTKDSNPLDRVKRFKQLIDKYGGIYFPMQEESGTAIEVYNSPLSVGRNVLPNPDFAADANWTKGTGWTISGGAAHAASAAVGQTLQQNIGLVIGRWYRIRVTASNYSAGTVLVRLGAGQIALTINANGYYSAVGQALGTTVILDPSVTLTCDFDDIYVEEINIAGNNGQYLGADLVTNGDFASGTGWILGSGWSVAGGVATLTADTGNLSQSLPMTVGKIYEVVYTIVSISGSIQPRLGSTGSAGNKSSPGTYVQVITCQGNTTLTFAPQATTTAVIDNVSVREVIKGQAPNLLADGDMEASGVGAWTSVVDGTLTKQTGTPFSGSQVLRLARNGTDNNPRYQQTIFSIGKIYRAFGYMRGDGSASPRIGTQNVDLLTGSSSNNWQYFELTFIATDTQFRIYAITSTGTQYVEFDQVTVVEDNVLLPGNRLQDGDMEASGVTWWTQFTTETLTKETTNPQSGAQCIRVARNGVNDPAFGQTLLILGKRYRARGYFRSDGLATARMGTGGTILDTTTSTNWVAFDKTFVADHVRFNLSAQTSTGTQYAEFDNVRVEEVSPMTAATGAIAASVTVNQPGLRSMKSWLFNGSTGYANPYTLTFSGFYNPYAYTGIALFKPRIYSASSQVITTLGIDIINTNQVRQSAMGKSQSATGLKHLGWNLAVATADIPTDNYRAFYNGEQVGVTQTGLTPLTTPLPTNATVLFGAANVGNANVYDGLSAGFLVLREAMQPEDVRQLARDLKVQFAAA